MRIYDTGDWGLYLPGGDIEFLGRDARQVKINGFRVELDEIEAHLSRQPSVARAAVFKNKANQLVAAVVPRDASCSASVLKVYLSGCLPAYMVPPQFRLLEQLPLTSNGKIDYSTLQRDPDPSTPADAPLSEVPTEPAGASNFSRTSVKSSDSIRSIPARASSRSGPDRLRSSG